MTTTDAPQTLTQRIAPTVAHLSRLLEQRADLDAHIEQAKADLRAAVPGPDTYDADGLTLVVTANRRLDVNTAANLLSVDARLLCRSTTYDAKLVRQHLTPAQVDACMVEVGEPRVSLR